MSKKQRIAALERRVAELEARPITYYAPISGVNPPWVWYTPNTTVSVPYTTVATGVN